MAFTANLGKKMKSRMSAEGLDVPGPQEAVSPAITTSRPRLLVFHINDSTDDQVLFQAACKKAGVPFYWHTAETAAGGIAYLESVAARSRTHAVRWPDLVVLDLAMPGENGIKVLEYIRAKPELRRLVVIVLTGHPDPAMAEEAVKLGANSVLRKPVDFGDTVKLMTALYEMWRMAKRPSI
jgi:CheY-like chemotaxis protein